jgi:hypothetical protein
MVAWIVRVVLGTVVVGLLQVFSLLLAVGVVWVGFVIDALRELWRRIRWGKR